MNAVWEKRDPCLAVVVIRGSRLLLSPALTLPMVLQVLELTKMVMGLEFVKSTQATVTKESQKNSTATRHSPTMGGPKMEAKAM